MNREGFSKGGNWYKGNLHSHTTNSDGHKTPAEIVEIYKSGGYDFLALTDHDIFSDYRSELGSDNFLIIPALEASIYYITDADKIQQYKDVNLTDTWEILYDEHKIPNCNKAHHFNVFQGSEKAPFQHLESKPPLVVIGQDGHADVLQNMVDEYLKMGCFMTYNHPLWSRIVPEDILDVKGFSSIEVYNHMTEEDCGLGADTTYMDLLLRKGVKINAMAADDNHNRGDGYDNYGGYVVVKAEELSLKAIAESLNSGNYYSSSGVEITEFCIENGEVYISCSPVKKINFVVGNRITDGMVVQERGKTITEARYTLKGHETYVRVECIGVDGKQAWTNPVYL